MDSIAGTFEPLMRLLLLTLLAVSQPGIGPKTGQGKKPTEATRTSCDAASLERLKNPVLFASFFHCVDSMRRVQYPNGEQDTTLSVDITPAVMKEFLEKVDHALLSRSGEAEIDFHFGVAPTGYTDPPACRDKVSVSFNARSCHFRMVVFNTFLVPPDWCTEGTVVYGFMIGQDRVLDFYRDEAG